jgi:hypothetical protein
VEDSTRREALLRSVRQDLDPDDPAQAVEAPDAGDDEPGGG